MFRVFSILLLLVAAAADARPIAVPPSPAGHTATLPNGSAPAAPHADRVTLEEAVRRVRKQYGGRIISAETRGSGDRRTHVIKVLTDDGRVHTVRIRAN